jgi:RNA-binding protein YlmH
LEKAAEEGDENAQFIIANLVKIGSGIVIASEIDEADVDVEQAQQTESMHTQELARKDAIIAELNESLTEALRALAVKTEEMNNALASKDDELAEKDSIIAQLKSGSATQTNPA